MDITKKMVGMKLHSIGKGKVVDMYQKSAPILSQLFIQSNIVDFQKTGHILLGQLLNNFFISASPYHTIVF